jgi:hypothetical protein
MGMAATLTLSDRFQQLPPASHGALHPTNRVVHGRRHDRSARDTVPGTAIVRLAN